MRIIDRYLLRQFILPFAVCMTAFIMVWIVVDLFNNFGDFIQGSASLASVVGYYMLLIPASLNYLVPASLMLAELYCLAKLTRHSELTAMRACGVNMVRLMAPFLGVGLVATLLVLGVNETVGSEAAYRAQQFVRSQSAKDKLSVYMYGPLPLKNPQQHRSWWVGVFNAQTYEMRNVEVLQQDENGRDLFKITAPVVQWLDGRWWFSDLHIQFYDEFNNPRGAPRMEKGREMPDFTERPQAFLNEVKDPHFMSAIEMWRYIRGHQSISGKTVTRLMVDMHNRLALPWACLAVTLLGVPFGSQTGRRGATMGIMLFFVLFFSTYVLMSIGLSLGKNGYLSPWLAGWGPMLLVFVYGMVLAVKMR